MNQKVDNFLAVIAVIVGTIICVLAWTYVPEDELDVPEPTTESCPSTSTSTSQNI